jgi:glycosyltransferase involved in cell wall biosynthesis
MRARRVSLERPTLASYVERLRDYRSSSCIRNVSTAGVPLSDAGAPLLSVVTVTFNSERTLERTIRSVLAQRYPHVEYIIVDGGSSDGTVDIIRRYERYLSYWHTGRDRGISDAFNLGIAATHGKYVALVNSDDWMSEDQGALAVEALERSGAAFVFGRLAFHEGDGALLYVMDGDPEYWRTITRGMPEINHPTVVNRRSSFEKIGLFDVRKRVAMDYDWHLRAEQHGLRGIYVPEIVGHMGVGGACFQNWAGGLREVRDAALECGQPRLPVIGHYLWRLFRGRVREAMYAALPAGLVSYIHRTMNPRYRPNQKTSAHEPLQP